MFKNWDRVRGPVEQAYQLAADESFECFREDMGGAMLFDDRFGLLKWVGRSCDGPGVVLEFGVMDGASLRVLRSVCPVAEVVGFDGFIGLREDWTGTRFGAGAVSRGGRVPKCVEGLGVRVVLGLVEDTLGPFLDSMGEMQIRLVHLDMDTYSPTLFALERLKPRLGGGAVVVFDELYNYPGWRDHEFRALTEVFDRSEYDFIAFGPMNVAIRLK